MLDRCQQVDPNLNRLSHFSHNNSNQRTNNRHLVAQEYSDMDVHRFDCMIHEFHICSQNLPV